MKGLVMLIALSGLAALGADIAGTWKGKAEGPRGTLERTFVFKVDGDKLTGETTSAGMGKSTIMDGKVEGDALSFSIIVKFQGNDSKVNYKGKVEGKEMKLTAVTADGQFILEWHLTKTT